MTQTSFKVEKGVPLSPKAGGRRSFYPWADMEVGDSFIAGPYSAKFQKSVINSAALQRRRHGRSFTTRKDGDNLRVWRIA